MRTLGICAPPRRSGGPRQLLTGPPLNEKQRENGAPTSEATGCLDELLGLLSNGLDLRAGGGSDMVTSVGRQGITWSRFITTCGSRFFVLSITLFHFVFGKALFEAIL